MSPLNFTFDYHSRTLAFLTYSSDSNLCSGNKVLSVHRKKPFCAWRTYIRSTFEFQGRPRDGTHKSLNTRIPSFHFASPIPLTPVGKGIKFWRFISTYTHPGIPVFGPEKPQNTYHSYTCKHGPAMTLPNRKVQSPLHALSRTDPFGSANLPERRSCSMHPVCHFAYPSQWAAGG